MTLQQTIRRAVALTMAVGGIALAVEPANTVVTPVVKYAAVPLPLGAVRLTGGPLKVAQDLDRAYLLKLEPDRMLAYLRERAGLPRKAAPYGGWDGSGRQLTGHIAGHYLSAVSLMYQATGDAQFKERADYIVGELKAVQAARGSGYIGAILGDGDRRSTASPGEGTPPNLVDGETLFQQITQGKIHSGGFDLNGMWSPWYTEHKLFAGLRDAYRETGNADALAVEIKFAEWVESIVGKLSDAQTQKMLETEFGGMNEVFVDLYADTGNARWLKLSEKFDHKAIIDPLARGEDVLGGKHGNCQIPKFIGELADYVYTGDQSAGNAASNFWTAVVDHHSFATGGHGYDEYFDKPDHLSGQVDGTGQRSNDLRTAESCNVYNMLKMTRRLFAVRPDVHLADFEERALFNHVLASINPNDGRVCYMVPVGAGVVHEYQSPFGDFTCCVGTGMENHALHGDGIYYGSNTGDRLWVNLYTPSTATWATGGASLKMETSFPLGDDATLKLSLPEPKTFTLELRRAQWAGAGFAVSVNGENVADIGEPDSYIKIVREWKEGDTISITLPHALHTDPLPDNPNRVALMWGPLVLAGDYGDQDSNDQAANASDHPADFPVFAHADQKLADWLQPVAGKPGTFSATTAEGKTMTLSPFYALHDRRYGLYWDLFTPSQWADQQAKYAAEQARQKQLAAATVAYVQIGQMQPERDFNFQGEASVTTRVDGQPGRRGGKWISFDVPVDSASPMTLIITTLANADLAMLGIKVDGVDASVADKKPEPGSRFADVAYRVPANAIAGKKRATIRLDAATGKELPAIFGLRVMRSADSDK